MTTARLLSIVAATMLLCEPGSVATAADYIIRGTDGTKLGRVVEGKTGVSQYDSEGKRLGTAEYSAGDCLVLRDSDGLRIGSAELGQGSRIIVKDFDGMRIGTIEEDSSKRLIMRDLEGHRVGTIQKTLKIMHKILFTQYILPNGRKREIDLFTNDDDIFKKSKLIQNAGFRFECEYLITKELSLTILDIRKDQDVAIEICGKGEFVLDKLEKLIRDFTIPKRRPT